MKNHNSNYQSDALLEVVGLERTEQRFYDFCKAYVLATKVEPLTNFFIKLISFNLYYCYSYHLCHHHNCHN